MNRNASPLHRLGASLAALVLLGPLGCNGPPAGGVPLTIATTWPRDERAEIETAFAHWRASAETTTLAPSRIDWVSLDPGDDLSTIVPDRGGPRRLASRIDIVLGGPATSYARLARLDRLEPVDRPGHSPWCISRRSPLGLATNLKTRAGAGRQAGEGPEVLTFDDPRHDPVALAWAAGRLARRGWADGYARLVRDAGHPRRIGRQALSSLAAVERGEARAAPAIAPNVSKRVGVVFLADAGAPPLIEGVAVLRGARQRESARAFVAFLDEGGQAGVPPPDLADDSDVASLLADLLGATLVDAQDELWAAWAELERAGHPARAEMWMTQAPPWPPASIVKLLDRDRSGALLQTLAAEIAPEADVRAWLLRSWLEPRRLIDGPLLAGLAQATGGRLVRAPRFRAWLRAEWTAWARQRYRRVARQASGGGPLP